MRSDPTRSEPMRTDLTSSGRTSSDPSWSARRSIRSAERDPPDAARRGAERPEVERPEVDLLDAERRELARADPEAPDADRRARLVEPLERDDELERDVVPLRPLLRAEDRLRDCAERPFVEPRLVRAPLRSSAGISSLTTAVVSCGIRRWRNDAMRSSWRLMSRATRAVSLSPTDLASASMAV